jgi:hypothetical protein
MVPAKNQTDLNGAGFGTQFIAAAAKLGGDEIIRFSLPAVRHHQMER